MTAADVELRHHIDPTVTATLVDVYADVYAEHLHEPFHTVEMFGLRLAGHVTGRHWECVIGYHGDEPVGYVYGTTLRADTTWWKDLAPPPDPELSYEDGNRTLAIFELMIRMPWRKQGLAYAIHEEFVTHRSEQRASLSVDHDHPRVRALYESWGYRYIGSRRPPGPEAPLLDRMLRQLR